MPKQGQYVPAMFLTTIVWVEPCVGFYGSIRPVFRLSWAPNADICQPVHNLQKTR